MKSQKVELIDYLINLKMDIHPAVSAFLDLEIPATPEEHEEARRFERILIDGEYSENIPVDNLLVGLSDVSDRDVELVVIKKREVKS